MLSTVAIPVPPAVFGTLADTLVLLAFGGPSTDTLVLLAFWGPSADTLVLLAFWGHLLTHWCCSLWGVICWGNCWDGQAEGTCHAGLRRADARPHACA